MAASSSSPDPVASGVPSAGSVAQLEGHLAPRADLIEETVFGVLDGVITSMALVVSVALVLQLPAHATFLTVAAAAVAGSISMFVGAHLSSRSRVHLILRERAREEREIVEKPDEERKEVRAIYKARGFSDAEADLLTARVSADPKRWVDMMMRDELGLDPVAIPTPLRHGAAIGLSYLLGSFLPAIPFLAGGESTNGMIVAALGIGGAELAVVGVLQAQFAGLNRAYGALEILAIGFGAALAVFAVTTVL